MENENNQPYPYSEAEMVWLIGCIIVAIVFLFSRRAGVAVLVLLSAVWIGLWLVTDRKAAQQASNRSVAITASADRQLCPDPNRPVSASLTNNASTPLESVSFHLVARERGGGSIIYTASHTTGKNMAPGESFTNCYELNRLSFADRTIQYDVRELDWSAEVSLTRFAGQ